MLSLSALRLAAIETLAPHAALTSGAWPTLAGKYVFDSWQGKVSDMSDAEPRQPIVAVYSDASEGTRRGDGGPWLDPFVQADLVLECEIPVLDTSDGAEALRPADSDHEAELRLDLLVAQCWKALSRQEPGNLFRQVCKSVETTSILPLRDAQFGLRFARRSVVLRCQVSSDVWTDAADLPEPFRRIHAALPAGSYGRAIADQIAGQMAATTRTPLGAVRIAAGLENRPADIDSGDVTAEARAPDEA